MAVVAELIVQLILIAVARNAVTGPAATAHMEPFALRSFIFALSIASCRTSAENQSDHTVRTQDLKGPVWASNAGSNFPEAPSITYKTRSSCLPKVALAAAEATDEREV